MKNADVLGLFFVVGTLASIAGVWWDWRKRSKEREEFRRRQEWRRYLNETVNRDNMQ